MEYVNKVEILGTIGRLETSQVGSSEVANISVCTVSVYNGQSGLPVCENTWHNVTAWKGPGICDFSQLMKGGAIHVIGRLRNRTYTSQNGEKRSTTEILASEVSVPMTDDLP